MTLIAAIDIGTTGARCMIFDLAGRCLGSAYEEYGLSHVKTGWIEQSIPDVLAATDRACRRATGAPGIDASQIASVGLSTQQCGTCAVDKSGNLIRPMLSWQDARATAEAGAIVGQFTMERYKAITGAPPMPNGVVAKMLWLRTHEPQTFERAAKWLQPHHIALRHLGAEDDFVDLPEVGYYGLWDVATRAWHPELLQFAGVTSNAFGHVVPAGTKVGQISASASERTGLPRGASLCVGAGDAACSLVGMGATSPGMLSVTLGTAGIAALSIDAPRTELAEFLVFGHPVPDIWFASGASLAAASAYRWFRDVFGHVEQDAAQRDGSNVFDNLNALCAQAPPASGGLLFLPYLNSAGTPHWNPEARAAFVGISQNHGRHHFARAVMEGVALEVQDMLTRFNHYGLRIGRIRVGGGAARSSLWTQIQANIYGQPVQRLKEGETTALGAAILAGVGAGVFSDIGEGVDAMVGIADTIEPQVDQTARYVELYAAYADAYRSLAPSTFSKLCALQR
ncbi:MAG: hypothetical protein KBA31_09865 [Alphaproteobacteria bacterium]|nr:hypothetical protein [Alphaproteobacteria bacterium]